MDTPQTWDSITSEASAPPPDPVPAAPTLEETAASQLEVETPAVARDGQTEPQTPAPVVEAPAEQPKVETAPDPEPEIDVQEGDPEELKGLRTPSQKEWARRQFQDAKLTREFDAVTEPIGKFAESLAARSPSRYTELANDLAESHPDFFAQKLFGMTIAEAKQRLGQNGQPAPSPAQAVQSSEAKPLTAQEIETMSSEEIAQRFNDFQSQAKTAHEAELNKLNGKIQELTTRFDDVDGKLKNQDETAFQQNYTRETNKLHDEIWNTVIDGGIRDSGLEVKTDDPTELASLKKAAQKLLRDEVDIAFAGEAHADDSKLTPAQKENRKVIQTVLGFAKRGEFQNAWREKDNLIVRGRAAFEAVKGSPELQAILNQIMALDSQSKAKTQATNPAPPVPGSSAGVVIKPPTSWDEAIEQSKAAGR